MSQPLTNGKPFAEEFIEEWNRLCESTGRQKMEYQKSNHDKLLDAVMRLRSLEAGGDLPWVHNASHTNDIEALRRICLVSADIWNNDILPILREERGIR